jgi:hypothetical protein
MVYGTRNYCVFGLCSRYDILKNAVIRKLDVFPWETPNLLGPLERANLNHWTSYC